MSQTNAGTFAELGIASNLLDVLTKKGFKTPTPIQQQVIPDALKGSDVIGIAQTGTGKTLAFAIPMLVRVSQTKGQGLIILPTRELAEQVESELQNIGGSLGLRTAILIGGTSEDRQIKALKQNPHIVVATPGRLMDFVDRKIFKLGRITIVTLDEADRMLDMGFLPSIKKVMQQVPDTRQTMLFSATMPKSIGDLAKTFMTDPLRVEIAPQGTSAKKVEQELYMVSKGQKMALLEHVLKQYPEETTIVFSRTKHGAKRIKQKLERKGHKAAEIHGNRSQNQRKKALEGFDKKRYRVLVATDVAARGIDVSHLGLVVNFDLPDNSLEDYVHRIGRTGRAGRSGRAISFATPDQKKDIRGIEKIISKKLTVLDLPNLPKEEKQTTYDRDKSMDRDTPRGNSDRRKRKRMYQRRSEAGAQGSTSRSKKQYQEKSTESGEWKNPPYKRTQPPSYRKSGGNSSRSRNRSHSRSRSRATA